MGNQLFAIIISETITPSAFFICTGASLVLGAIIAIASLYKSRTSASFAITLALLPPVVQLFIMMIGDNIGAAIAVLCAVSMIKLRSTPGTGREALSILVSIAAGLAVGMGQIMIAFMFTIIILLVYMLYMKLSEKEADPAKKELKITIPESLDYSGIFDDIFAEFTSEAELMKVKTTDMGSLFQLTYQITIKDQAREKEMLDQIRCRNGNLDITCGRKDDGPQ